MMSYRGRRSLKSGPTDKILLSQDPPRQLAKKERIPMNSKRLALLALSATISTIAAAQTPTVVSRSSLVSVYARVDPYKKKSIQHDDSKTYAAPSGWVILSATARDTGSFGSKSLGIDQQVNYHISQADIADMNAAYNQAITAVSSSGLSQGLQSFIISALSASNQAQINYAQQCNSGYVSLRIWCWAKGNGIAVSTGSQIGGELDDVEMQVPNWYTGDGKMLSLDLLNATNALIAANKKNAQRPTFPKEAAEILIREPYALLKSLDAIGKLNTKGQALLSKIKATAQSANVQVQDSKGVRVRSNPPMKSDERTINNRVTPRLKEERSGRGSSKR
jgi:hypothetical protein